MSEDIALSTGEPEKIHGTLVAAKAYVGMMFGDAYKAWMDLVGEGAAVDDPKKQTLATAVRYFNAQNWGDAAATFELRDAIPEFALAEYELAVLVAGKPTITQALDTSSNLKSVGGSGVPGVEFFNPTSVRAGTATVLPPTVQRLVGKYLAASTKVTGAAQGAAGLCAPCGPGWGRSGPF